MVLKTLEGEYPFKAGECIFAKKGSIVAARHLIQEDFCELRIFIPDDFIKSVFQKYRIALSDSNTIEKMDTVIPIATDAVLTTYFHSLLTYFHQSTPPPGTLLKLKFEELLINILSGNAHRSLKCFFGEISRSAKPSIKEIMEANFFSNLSLQEFARLCSRSLSAFKQEFKNIFQTTPGKWLQEKRLEYSRYLLETTTFNVDEVCAVAGFENRSHLSVCSSLNLDLPLASLARRNIISHKNATVSFFDFPAILNSYRHSNFMYMDAETKIRVKTVYSHQRSAACFNIFVLASTS